MKRFLKNYWSRIIPFLVLSPFLMAWGTFGHEHINRAAVMALPAPMQAFFFNHIDFMTTESTIPDVRKYTLRYKAERPRHYIDLERYGTMDSLPATMKEAEEKYSPEFLQKNGILPWYIEEMMKKLTTAFKEKSKNEILYLAADLGHYVGDAHMPLHTSVNHDGQLTGQRGIHSFWESQLPEMFGDQYNYNCGQAKYIKNIHQEVWKILRHSHQLADTLLLADRELKKHFKGDVYEKDASGKIRRNKYHQPIHTEAYARAYNKALNGMVEKQLRSSIIETADFWYTAWVNAGKPDLTSLDPAEQTKRNQPELKRELQLCHQGKLTDLKGDKEF